VTILEEGGGERDGIRIKGRARGEEHDGKCEESAREGSKGARGTEGKRGKREGVERTREGSEGGKQGSAREGSARGESARKGEINRQSNGFFFQANPK